MQIKKALFPEALLLMMVGVVLLIRWRLGQLALYIHPRYHLLLAGVGGLLIVVGLLRMVVGTQPVRPMLLVLPALVVALMLLVPARPLGAQLIANRSIGSQSNTDLIAALERSRSSDTRDWSLLEWTAVLSKNGVAALVGKPIRIEGFVFRSADLPDDTVMVGRYVVTCCTADGRALALPVKVEHSEQFANDQWVRVEGTFGSSTAADGTQIPLINGTLTPIDVPAVPYLYP